MKSKTFKTRLLRSFTRLAKYTSRGCKCITVTTNFFATYKNQIPTTEKLLVPNVSRHVSESITRKRQLTKYSHDKKSKILPALEQGQPVYVWHEPVEKETPWDSGIVKHVLNDRSYIVSTDGYDARRNRTDIREWTCSNGEMMTNSEQNTSTTSDPINSENQSIRTSSRTIKPHYRRDYRLRMIIGSEWL